MNVQTNKKGFTIIEVVLVLAIAALIFLMIFIALPALQRGQRDTARRNDVNSIVSAIGNYRTNSDGKLTGLSTETIQPYVKDQISQIVAENITVGSGTPGEDTAVVTVGKKCDGNTLVDGTSRTAAVQTKLESGNQVICESA